MDIPQPLIDSFWATVQTLLVFVGPAVVTWVVAKVAQTGVEMWAEFKLDNYQVSRAIENAVALAVQAAEQNGLNGELMKAGLAKKDYAIQIAEAYLKSVGVKIDLDVVAAAIEAKVLELYPKSAPPARGRAPEADLFGDT